MGVQGVDRRFISVGTLLTALRSAWGCCSCPGCRVGPRLPGGGWVDEEQLVFLEQTLPFIIDVYYNV
jgi:hypothetical protein